MSFRVYCENINDKNVDIYVVFPGRFQPFTNGHLNGIESAIQILGKHTFKFFILTSDIIGPKSILNFNERKQLIEAGTKKVSHELIIQELRGHPYNFINMINNIHDIDISKHHLVIFVMSTDDANRVSGKTIQSPDDIDEVISNTEIQKRYEMKKAKFGEKFDDESFAFSAIAKITMPRVRYGDEEVSGTKVREAIQNNDWAKVQQLVPYTITPTIKRILRKFSSGLRSEKQLHLLHLEKAIVSPSKFDEVVALLEKLIDGDKNIIVNQKIDGRPVIVFGRDESNRFFVAMKQDAMNGDFMFSPKDIETQYEFDSSNSVPGNVDDIKKKLKNKVSMFQYFLKTLSTLSIDKGTAYSADVLFYPGFGFKQVRSGMYSVKPNTTWYIATNNTISNRIKNADMGIAVHTKFDYKDKQLVNQQEVTKETSGLAETPQIFIPNTKIKIEPMANLKNTLEQLKKAKTKEEKTELIQKIKNQLLEKYNKAELRAEVSESDTSDVSISDQGEGLVVSDSKTGTIFKIVDIEKFTKSAQEIHAMRKQR